MRATILISLALCGCDGVFKLVEVRDPVPVDARGQLDGGPLLVPEGLVAYYPFDDDIDDSMVDDLAGDNDGSCQECPVPTPALFGAALLFDGRRQYVHVSSAPELITSSAFTVAAWVRLDKVTATDSCPASRQYVGTFYNTYQLCVTPAKTLAFYSYDETNLHLQTGPELPLGEWHHVALRYDGTAKAIVLDGIIGVPAAVQIAFDTTSSITFGADIDNAQIVGGFSGAIDEVRIYDRALTPVELGILASPPL